MLNADHNMFKVRGAPKQEVTLLLNSKVLETAHSLAMDVSATVDALLMQEVRRRY